MIPGLSASVLAPGALLLGALLALPVAAHLARQVPRDRLPFGAMLLLQRVVKRLRRRRRVKDPLLLLVRLLAVAAAVFAATGPAVSVPGPPPTYGGSGKVVLVVDRSLSMAMLDRGATLLQQARDRATAVVRELPPGTRIGLVVFDDHALRLTLALTDDKDRVLGQIAAIEGSSGRSHLREGLLEARRLLAGEAGEVVVLTDEAGPRMVGEATDELARLVEAGSSVIPERIAGQPPRNVAVSDARYGDGPEGGRVTVRVVNYGPDPIEVSCEVVLPDGARIPIFVDLPPDGEAEERITVPAEAQGGVGRVQCDDPDLPLDDARFFHLPRVGASRVLVVDGDPGDTPTRSETYFLEKALAPWGGRSGVAVDVLAPAGLAEISPETHRVVFLANVADPRPFGPRLVDFVRRGGALVVGAGDQVTAERYDAALGSILPAPLRATRAIAAAGEVGEPLALPDADVPLFAPFRRSGRAAFGRIRSHTVVTLDPYQDVEGEVATLLRYENGLPALVERRTGEGRVVLWTSSFDLGWSNAALQAVYMPLVQRLVTWLGAESGAVAERVTGVVGDPVVIELPDLLVAPEVVGPEGTPVESRTDGTRLSFVPDRAGAYVLTLEGSPPLAYVAVNTDPAESDVRSTSSIAAVERELAPGALTRRVDLARPLWGLALVGLLAQGLLSIRRPEE
jgi:hypothetical protein